MKKIYNKSMDYISDAIKNFALERIIKSEYIKDSTTVIPLTLMTILTKSLFNFLILGRLYTNIYYLDFMISVMVTIFLSFSSPHIHNIFSTVYNKQVTNFTGNVLDSVWDEGWNYVNKWKNRIFGFIGVTVILLLFLVDVNSRMIQEFIVHTIITTVIIDYLNNISYDLNLQITQKLPPDIKKLLSIRINSSLILMKPDKHVVYKISSTIETNSDKENWTSYHRYSDFENFHNRLKRGNFLLPELPAKTWGFGQFDKKWIELRGTELNFYMNSILGKREILNNEFYFNMLLKFLRYGEAIS